MKSAVIGVGRMGKRHVEVVRGLGLPLVGIADRNLDVLNAAGAELSIPEANRFSVVRDLLETKKPELVVIATTAPTHAEYVIAAAESGAKAILCEKPMATSLVDCDRMITACERAGARLAINHQMRFMEQYTRPKELLESEEFGGLCSITLVAGNFGLAMNGSHYLEMFRFMTDQEPVEASAWFSVETVSNPRGPEFVDRAGMVRFATASGKRFVMEIGADQGHGMHAIYGARHGQIFVDELAGFMRIQCRNAEHRSLPTTRYGMPHSTRTEQIAPADALGPTRAVLQALLAGTDFPTGHDGRLAVTGLVAAYVSEERGHVPVDFADPGIPRDRLFPWA